MIREFALETLDACEKDRAERPAHWSDWANMSIGNPNFPVALLMRHFNFRYEGDVKIVEAIFKAYELPTDWIQKKATDADLYWKLNRTTLLPNGYSVAHLSPTSTVMRALYMRVNAHGIELLINSIPDRSQKK